MDSIALLLLISTTDVALAVAAPVEHRQALPVGAAAMAAVTAKYVVPKVLNIIQLRNFLDYMQSLTEWYRNPAKLAFQCFDWY